jgi:hypothetical protein
MLDKLQNNTVAKKYPLIYLYAGLNSIILVIVVISERFNNVQIQNAINKSISHAQQHSNTLNVHQLTNIAYISFYGGVTIVLAINLFFVLTKSFKILKVIFILSLIFSILSLVTDLSRRSIFGLFTTLINIAFTAVILKQMKDRKETDDQKLDL